MRPRLKVKCEVWDAPLLVEELYVGKISVDGGPWREVCRGDYRSRLYKELRAEARRVKELWKARAL